MQNITSQMPLIERMAQYEPVQWTSIPDLGLYMDQVLTYIEQQLYPLYGERVKGIITPSMINNYVKSGLVNRPTGKKYYREQLALLMMIVTLKPTASMDDIAGLTALEEGQSVQQLYDEFRQTQIQVLRTISIDPTSSALRHAVTATAYRLVTESLLTPEPEQ